MFKKRPWSILMASAIVAVSLFATPAINAAAPPGTNGSTQAVGQKKTDKVHDVYSAFDALADRGEALQVKGLADGATDGEGVITVSWDGYEPIISLDGIAYTDLVVTRTKTHIIAERLPDLAGGFRAVFSTDSSGNLVAQLSSLVDTNGVQFDVDVIAGTVSAAEVCVCHGSSATSPVRACTNAECNDPGVQCNTNPGAATHYCAWRTQQTTPSGRPIEVSIVNAR